MTVHDGVTVAEATKSSETVAKATRSSGTTAKTGSKLSLGRQTKTANAKAVREVAADADTYFSTLFEPEISQNMLVKAK